MSPVCTCRCAYHVCACVYAHAVVCMRMIAYGFPVNAQYAGCRCGNWHLFRVGSWYNDSLVSAAARRCARISQINRVEVKLLPPTHRRARCRSKIYGNKIDHRVDDRVKLHRG